MSVWKPRFLSRHKDTLLAFKRHIRSFLSVLRIGPVLILLTGSLQTLNLSVSQTSSCSVWCWTHAHLSALSTRQSVEPLNSMYSHPDTHYQGIQTHFSPTSQTEVGGKKLYDEVSVAV